MRALVAALLLAMTAGGAALAAEQTEDVNPDYVLNIAKGFGSADMEQFNDGTPYVVGRMEGSRYGVFLIGCEDKPSCSIIQFTAQFPGDKASPAALNKWNLDKRFGKVGVADNGKLWVTQAILVGEGLPRPTIERYFALWQLVLRDFKEVAAGQ